MTASKTFRYLNPWSADPATKPEFFVSHVKPVDYRGFQIVRRLPNSHELVKDGVCLTQRAGGGALREIADALISGAPEHLGWHLDRIREVAARHGVKFQAAA